MAKMGFRVTGVDFIPEMVRRAEKNAVRLGVPLTGVVQEISRLDFPAESFDAIMISADMYSCVPTRMKRREMLGRIRRALKPGGYLVCQFHWDPRFHPNPQGEIIRKIFALSTLGNLRYERGDMLWGYVEFIHAFASEKELRQEFGDGGFEVMNLHLPDGGFRGGAVLRKSGAPDETVRS